MTLYEELQARGLVAVSYTHLEKAAFLEQLAKELLVRRS